MKLEPKDYELLQFIADNPAMSESEIENALSGKIYGIHYRLVELSMERPPQPGRPFGEDTSPLIHSRNNYQLSNLGYVELENWKTEQQQRSKSVREERLWRAVPIIISIVSLIVSIYTLNKQP